MKALKLSLCALLMAGALFTSACSTTMNGPAGAGTSQTSAASGGPGHGPEGAMNGTQQH